MSEEEYEEYEEGEEVEESNNQEQVKNQADDPQDKNTNIVVQPKAEDKKSNSKKSGSSKISNAKNSSNKKSSAENKKSDNKSKNKASSKDNKSKASKSKKDENAYKISNPEQVVSTRAYLEKTVSSVIQEALLELAKQRPENPLEFVGNYILKKAKEK